MAYTQDNRFMAIETPLGKDVLLLAGLKGTEELSKPFRFELDLRSEKNDIVFKDIIGKNVTVSIVLADGDKRYLNGVVSRFSYGTSQGEEDIRLFPYRAVLRPDFWLLTHTSNLRIFQKLSVPDIVKKILDERGVLHKLLLDGSYQPRTYCVQYRESEFDFISRLLEEEGIYYFFEHEDGKHTLVLGNAPDKHQPCPKQASARFQASAGGPSATSYLEEDVITSMEEVQEIRANKVTLTDYNEETPTTDLTYSVSAKQKLVEGDWEKYDYPGEYLSKGEGEHYGNVWIEGEELQITTLTGLSHCRAFTGGYRYELGGHPQERMNNKWYVLTSVYHEATTKYGTGSGEGDFDYSNQFTCTPHDVPYRPPRDTRKPLVYGTQTAFVVGPAGEEIYTDDHGRVKVQFHWDREGKRDENSSCWIRVAQDWAGKRWGAIFLPRIGQEVIVDFLEGDPDRPIITGCVYNGVNTPPYSLPGEKTKSTIKSDSSLGGEGFNEIRFEDKKGDEQIFIHAERNQDIRVKNDRRETILHDRHLLVENDKYEEIKKNRHELVHENHLEEIKGDRSLKVLGNQKVGIDKGLSVTVGGDVNESFGADHAEKVSGDYSLKCANAAIEASSNITLQVGQSYVAIEAGGIKISTMGTLELESTGQLSIKGTAGVKIETPAMLEEQGTMTTVKASGVLTLQGALVKIN